MAFDKSVKIYLTEIEAVACNNFAVNFRQQRVVKFRTRFVAPLLSMRLVREILFYIKHKKNAHKLIKLYFDLHKYFELNGVSLKELILVKLLLQFLIKSLIYL